MPKLSLLLSILPKKLKVKYIKEEYFFQCTVNYPTQFESLILLPIV